MTYEPGVPLNRGVFFRGQGTIKMADAENLALLPKPLLPDRSHWLRCYDYAWRTAFSNIRQPMTGSGFLSSFVDAAFNMDIFLWDTVFITMFCDLGRAAVPGVEALDNFYCKQLPDGEIPRELVRETGEDVTFWRNDQGLPLHSYFHNHYGFRGLRTMAPPPKEAMYYPDLGREQEQIAHYTLDNLNHPLLAWAELTSFAQTGNRERLARVYPALLAQYRSYHRLLRHANGLYVTDWASMDNSQRNPYLGCGVDISCEMAMFAKHLLEIGGITGLGTEERAGLTAEYQALKAAINTLMWDEETGFYYDLTPEGTRAPIKTLAAYWALAAGVAGREQAERLSAWLDNPDAFRRPHRLPVTPADEPGYEPRGGYWRGSVWPPMNTMVLYGLEQYGYHDQARNIALNHVEAVARVFEDTGTIWENYPADFMDKGDSDHGAFVGWSGIGPIRYLLRYGVGLVPNAAEGKLLWRLPPDIPEGETIGCRGFAFGGVRADVLAKRLRREWEIQVRTDRPFLLVCTGGGEDMERQAEGTLCFRCKA